MTKFTEEQLIEHGREQAAILQRRIKNADDEEWALPAWQSLALLEIALVALTAGMEPEPVHLRPFGDDGETFVACGGDDDRAITLYAAPQLPQPAVPDELAEKSFEYIANKFQVSMSEAQWILVGWNACRAAMLQLSGNSEQLEPATLRDGWVAVPVEPTENMVIAGFEAELREEFRDPEAWEALEAMSGCEQAALRAKWCWAAMIAARPKLKHDLT